MSTYLLYICRHAAYLCRHAAYYVDLPLISFSMHHIQYQHANYLFNMQLGKNNFLREKVNLRYLTCQYKQGVCINFVLIK